MSGTGPWKSTEVEVEAIYVFALEVQKSWNETFRMTHGCAVPSSSSLGWLCEKIPRDIGCSTLIGSQRSDQGQFARIIWLTIDDRALVGALAPS